MHDATTIYDRALTLRLGAVDQLVAYVCDAFLKCTVAS
jgi:hypothetical protein